MRIVALEPFAVDILGRLDAQLRLVGTSHRLEACADNLRLEVVTRQKQQSDLYPDSDAGRCAEGLTRDFLNIEQLTVLAPDVVLADIRVEDREGFISWADSYLSRELGREVRVQDISVKSLDDVYRVIEELGALVGNRIAARGLVSTIKAQLMQWADSFFDRCRGKQVAVVSQADPMVIEGRWFPDLIRLFGARPVEHASSNRYLPLTWSDIVAARVDVIVVAPEYGSITDSVKVLPTLQALSGWEEVPAVKRGEVIFAPGSDLYRPGPRFLKGAAIVASAIAGLDSGYITERDEYFRVRYLELHRHRFL